MALLLLCFGVFTAPCSLENPSAFSRTYQSDGGGNIQNAGNILCHGVSLAPRYRRPFVCSQGEEETDKGEGLGGRSRHLCALACPPLRQCPQLPDQNSHHPGPSDVQPALTQEQALLISLSLTPGGGMLTPQGASALASGVRRGFGPSTGNKAPLSCGHPSPTAPSLSQHPLGQRLAQGNSVKF